MSLLRHLLQAISKSVLAGPKTVALLFVALLGLWLLLTSGDLYSLVIGLPTVTLALILSLPLMKSNGEPSERRISWWGLACFVPFFIRNALQGGCSVALLALAPKRTLQPGFCSFTCRLTQPRARVFMMYCINLLPGTLATKLDGNRMELHQLMPGSDCDRELRQLEQAVAHVFSDTCKTQEA